MPFEIPLSKLGGDRAAFEQEVAAHIARMVAFTKQKGQPRPMCHPLVEAAVKRVQYPVSAKKPDEYVADYVIVDDTPPAPSISLDDKKRMLSNAVHAAEFNAKEKVFPSRKQRLFMIGITALLTKKPDDLTEDEKTQLAAYNDLKARMAAVELKAAKAESDVEDLTEDTVDSWQVPELG